MSDELSLDNLSGLELFEKICEGPEQGENIVKKIESTFQNEWKAKDFRAKILASGIELQNWIRLPNKQLFENFEVAINAITYELLVKVDNIWWQTGFPIKTREVLYQDQEG